MGMSEKKRAAKLGHQVDGGHPKPDQDRPTGKSKYAERHAAPAGHSAQALLALLEAEKAPPLVIAPHRAEPSDAPAAVKAHATGPANGHAKPNGTAYEEAPVPTIAVPAATAARSDAMAGFLKAHEALDTVIDKQLAALGNGQDAAPHRRETFTVKPLTPESIATTLTNFRKFLARLPKASQREIMDQLQRDMGKVPSPDAGIEFGIASERTPQALLISGQAFQSACVEAAVRDNPLSLEGPEKKRFEGILKLVLNSRSLDWALRQAQPQDSFPLTLGDRLLMNMVHQIRSDENNRRAFDYLIDEHSPATVDSPATFVLKPQVADAVEAFGRKCMAEIWPRYAGQPAQQPDGAAR